MKPLTGAVYKEIISRTAEDWQSLGAQSALKLFRQMAKRVPAYKDYLKKNDINPALIKSVKDFERLPGLTKEDYFRSYSLEQLCWDGKLSTSHMVTASSGSTGEPTFWPISPTMEKNNCFYMDLLLRHNFKAFERSTLVVNCFALGNWTGGIFCNQMIWDFAAAGFPVTLTSPGINKADALKCIKKLAPLFEQTIILAYPPFGKDLIDEGELEGMDWKQWHIGMITAGESFNESWRDYVAEKLAVPPDNIINFYAADSGILGIETRMSLNLRRQLTVDQELGAKVYGQERMPIVAQYNPECCYVEEVDGNLMFTRNDTVPAIRYAPGDQGGLISFHEATSVVDAVADDFSMPLVYAFGRAHHTATIYGLNVFPENIRAVAEDPRVRHHLSGKFLANTRYNDEMNQELEIVFQLAPGRSGLTDAERQAVHEVVLETIPQLNSEYRHLLEMVGEKAHPRLKFLDYTDQSFSFGAKQKDIINKKK